MESVVRWRRCMRPSPFIRLCHRKRRKVSKRPQGALPQLTCVAVVVRNTCLPVGLALCIDELLDESVGWTLESASDEGFLHLLDRLLAKEWSDVIPVFRSIRMHYAVVEAAKRGNLDVLKWWVNSYYQGLDLDDGDEEDDGRVYNTVFTLAIARGHVDILKWMKEQGKLPNRERWMSDLHSSHPQVISWLHAEGNANHLDVEFHAIVAIEGNLEYMKWLHQYEKSFKSVNGWSWIASFAAYEGQFEIVQWLYANRPNDMTDGVFNGAIAGGHLEIAKWAFPKGFREEEYCESLTCSPFKSVDMPMFKWILHENRWSSKKNRKNWTETISRNAIKIGSLEVIKLVCKHQVSKRRFDFSDLVERAAAFGRLDALLWFRDHGASFSLSATNAAARNGHINVIEWFHANHPELITRQTVNFAVSEGQLNVFKWLHEHELVVINSDMVREIIERGHLKLLQYVAGHSDPSQWRTGTEMQTALEKHHFEMAEWLYISDLSGSFTSTDAACVGYVDCMKDVLEGSKAGCLFLEDFVAGKCGNFDVLEWILQQNQSIIDQNRLNRLRLLKSRVLDDAMD